MNDPSALHELMWNRLPTHLPSNPLSSTGEILSVDQIDQLPSMWSMYRTIIFRRKPQLARDQPIPQIAAETMLTIDPEWVSNYRAICGLSSTSSDAPLPLTVPQVFAAPLHTYLLTHPHFPLSALGVVHAANEMISIRPIRAGESLRVRVWVGETRWKNRGVEFDFHTAVFNDQHQDPAWLARTVIFRSIKMSDRIDHSTSTKPPERILEGEEHQLILNADLGRRYAPIAGDYNPIHLYPITARLFGFKRPIVHGMWTLAHIMGVLSNNDTSQDRDDANLASDLSVGSLHVRFRRPLYLPNQVKFITMYANQGWCSHILDHRDKIAVEAVFNPWATTNKVTSQSDIKA